MTAPHYPIYAQEKTTGTTGHAENLPSSKSMHWNANPSTSPATKFFLGSSCASDEPYTACTQLRTIRFK